MAIYRGNGGSLDGLTESEVILLAISQGGTGSATAAGARTNLGLGTAATTDASAYATAAQGAKADTAIQALDLATVATTGAYSDLTGKPTVPTNLDSLTDVVITSATNGQSLQYNGTNWVNGSAGSGTVTSVALSAPTGLTVSGSPITTSGTLALTYTSGYAIPTTAKQTEWDTAYGWGNHATAGYLTSYTETDPVYVASSWYGTTNNSTNWNTAYTDRFKWDGGSTGLNAATGRTSLGLGTAATTDSTAYATAAQGAKADTALQSETYTGTVTSVALSVPTGLSVSGTPITSSGTLAVTFTAGYSIPTTSSQSNWDTAYTDRNKWDGGATGLTASTGRTSLGATTVGSNLFTLTNPSAVTFVRLNADNTVSALSASDFRTAIGAGTSSTTGTVTSVSGTGTVNGLTLTGTVTGSGSLTLGGTLSLASPPAIGETTPSTGSFTTIRVGSASILGNSNADVTLGLTVRNSSTSMGYLQTYNANAGSNLKTWRMGGNGSGNFVFETVNDAYSSSTNRMTLDSTGNLTATSFNGTIDGGTY